MKIEEESMLDHLPVVHGSRQEEARDARYFALLTSAKCLLLTSFARDCRPESAAVQGLVDDDGRVYFRARSQSRTVRNLRYTEEVQVAPGAVWGFVRLAPPLDAIARPLAGEQSGEVAARLGRKYPMQRLLIPALRRARRWQPVYYELVSYEAAALGQAPPDGSSIRISSRGLSASSRYGA